MECLLLNVPQLLPLDPVEAEVDHGWSNTDVQNFGDVAGLEPTEIAAFQQPEEPLATSSMHDTMREILFDIILETDDDALMATQEYLEKACAKLLESPDLLANPQACSMLARTLHKIKDQNAKRQALDDARAEWAVNNGGRLEHGRESWRTVVKNTADRPPVRNSKMRNQDLLATAVLLPHGATLILERWRGDVDAIVDGFAEVTTGELVLKRATFHKVYRRKHITPGGRHYMFLRGIKPDGRKVPLPSARNCFRQASLSGQAVELSKRAGGGQIPLSLWSQVRVWAFAYVKFTGEEGGFLGLCKESWEEAVKI